eukprot:352770-Chlamydomonas_euryale.AAC.8
MPVLQHPSEGMRNDRTGAKGFSFLGFRVWGRSMPAPALYSPPHERRDEEWGRCLRQPCITLALTLALCGMWHLPCFTPGSCGPAHPVCALKCISSK